MVPIALLGATAIQIYLIGTHTLAGLAVLAVTSALSARSRA
jgi:energy-converting hydrogenase Eha subunit A